MSRTHLELLEIADRLIVGDNSCLDGMSDREQAIVALAAVDVLQVKLICERVAWGEACTEIGALRARLAALRKRK